MSATDRGSHAFGGTGNVRETALVTSTGRRLNLAQLAEGRRDLGHDDPLSGALPAGHGDVVAAARDAHRAGLGNKIVFLSLVIDPTPDTLARLAAYRRF